MPVLVLLGNFPTHQAVGTSLLVIALASFSGFLGHLSFGGIDLPCVGFCTWRFLWRIVWNGVCRSRIRTRA